MLACFRALYLAQRDATIALALAGSSGLPVNPGLRPPSLPSETAWGFLGLQSCIGKRNEMSFPQSGHFMVVCILVVLSRHNVRKYGIALNGFYRLPSRLYVQQFD